MLFVFTYEDWCDEKGKLLKHPRIVVSRVIQAFPLNEFFDAKVVAWKMFWDNTSPALSEYELKEKYTIHEVKREHVIGMDL